MSVLNYYLLVTVSIGTAMGQDCVVVADGVVRLKDLAPSGTLLANSLGEDRGDDFLFFAPVAGTTRWVSSEERTRLLNRRGVEKAAVPGICIRSASRVVDPDELRLAMLQAFASNAAFKAQVKVEVIDWSRYPTPDGRIEFSLSALPRRVDGAQPVLWKGWVRLPTGRSVPVWAKAKLTTDCIVATALRSHPSGHRLGEADFAVERREVFPTQVLLAKGPPTKIAGRLLRHAVKSGDILTAQDLMEPVAVQSGQVLAAEVQEGAVRLKVEVIAETKGRIGDTIWLHSSSGGRRFRGTVLSDEQVRVVPEVSKPLRKMVKEDSN
ncbi:MAG: flagellar basal body P-ring formation protein FlgA [Acidobacteria bacterium]|nr:flagellar basal body P-ring formation protein FlgA [Acidobacteriota bacterium]